MAYFYSVISVPKITRIGQLLLKLLLVVAWYPFSGTGQYNSRLHLHNVIVEGLQFLCACVYVYIAIFFNPG